MNIYVHNRVITNSIIDEEEISLIKIVFEIQSFIDHLRV